MLLGARWLSDEPRRHDCLIAYVLGLSHAVNIAFFSALAVSGEDAPRLARMSSATCGAQLEVARRVANESPDLYCEIQQPNDFEQESLDALARAVGELQRAVCTGDATAFEGLMARGREYLSSARELDVVRPEGVRGGLAPRVTPGGISRMFRSPLHLDRSADVPRTLRCRDARPPDDVAAR